jgi:SAM-dependent methyltransferase
MAARYKPTTRDEMMNGPAPANLKCLLCGSDRLAIRQSLSVEDILKCWALDGHQFQPAAIQNLLDEGIVHLHDCQQCGFQFFNPKLCGSAEFYEQFHGSGRYDPDRPEMERNVRFAVRRNYRTILDVGCGSGIALDAAKRARLETFGLELNRAAAAAAAQKGHTIFPGLLGDLKPEWEGKFDLISLNQVLEHVPDPAGLVGECVRFLSPQGAIAIAVPGADGILRLTPWLESQWPPHHVTRWRKSNFDTLAQRASLRVIETGGDELVGNWIEWILLVHQKRCRVLGKRSLPVPAIKCLSLVYRKTGMKYLFRAQGHSIYCYLGR